MDFLKKVKTATVVSCLLGSFTLWPGGSQATIITTGCGSGSSCTLTELFAGGSMEVNTGYSDLLFHNFSQELLQTTLTPNLSLITVTGLDTGQPGFRIDANNQFVITNTDFIALNVMFKVNVLAGHLLDDNSLAISGSATGSGHAQVDENVFDSNGIFLGTKHTDIDPFFGVNVLYDHLDFSKTPDLWIEKNILVEGRNVGDTAQIISITQLFSVPEPTTIALMGIGLAGMWLSRRHASKAQVNRFTLNHKHSFFLRTKTT